MSILKAEKLQTRILQGYSVPLALLVLFGLIMGGSVIFQSGIANERARANQTMSYLKESQLGVSRVIRTARGAGLFPKDNALIESFNTGVEDYKNAVIEVDERIRDEQQKKSWAEFKDESDRIIKQSESAMALIQQGKVSDAIKIISGIEMRTLNDIADKMDERQENIIGDIRKKDNLFTTIFLIIVILGTIVGIVGTLALGTLISSKIAQEVKRNITEITSSSNEIATAAEQQAASSNEQAAAVNETTTTMDELGASSRQSEEQAESASQAAQEVLKLAENGNHAVEDTVATMMELKNKVLAIADQTMRLSEQTNQIGNISQLVSDLAQQTNMLALNASVEAVRAGEHGKGFSVVAEEIRKLADESKDSAQKISVLVGDIQNAINTTVMVTDEGTKTVNSGMQVTERTAQAFAGVAEAINNVVMNNQQITLNIRQQSRAVQQVLASMEQINQGAQQNASGVQQIKVGTKQINEKARNLEALV